MSQTVFTMADVIRADPFELFNNSRFFPLRPALPNDRANLLERYAEHFYDTTVAGSERENWAVTRQHGQTIVSMRDVFRAGVDELARNTRFFPFDRDVLFRDDRGHLFRLYAKFFFTKFEAEMQSVSTVSRNTGSVGMAFWPQTKNALFHNITREANGDVKAVAWTREGDFLTGRQHTYQNGNIEVRIKKTTAANWARTLEGLAGVPDEVIVIDDEPIIID